eukprot:1724626-Rhodomonas_salina.5
MPPLPMYPRFFPSKLTDSRALLCANTHVRSTGMSANPVSVNDDDDDDDDDADDDDDDDDDAESDLHGRRHLERQDLHRTQRKLRQRRRD